MRDIQDVPVTYCLYCGKRLTPPKKLTAGRKRRYCDRTHKDKAYRARTRHLLAESRR